MCHLGAIPTFRSSGRKRKMASSDCEVISFDSALKEAPKCLSEFNRSHALNRNKKKQFLHWFREMIHWPSCRLAFGKPDISGVGSYERNYDGKPSSVIVVCPI